MELLVACVIAYYLVRHGPELIAEALAEAEFARRGMLSPAAAARMKRLRDAGIDPAAGGAARQFFGNVWRDAWLDLDAARAKRRAAATPDGGDGSSRANWRAKFDAATEKMAARWRARDEGPSNAAQDPEPATGNANDNPGGSPDPAPSPGGSTDGGPGTSNADKQQPATEPTDQHQPDPEPAPTQEPIRVTSEQGEPIRDTAPTAQPATGGTTMAGTAVVHVTGVASAAAEARAIQRQIEAATAAYQAALAKVRNRAIALGSSTVTDIQQALSSDTVAAIMAACEAIAVAEAHAGQTSAEAGPAMGRVARAFDRIAV